MCIYVAHASGDWKSHDLSGEGIKCGSHTYFFDQTRTWRASPDEGSVQFRATSEILRTLNTINTIQSLMHSKQGEYDRMIIIAKWYIFRDLVLQVRKNPEKKPHPGNLSRLEIERGPATTWPTVVDKWNRIYCLLASSVFCLLNFLTRNFSMYRLWEPHRLLLRVNNLASYGYMTGFGVREWAG